MPTYLYKAVTKSGKIVKNKVDDISKLSLVSKLKRNNLIPLDVVQSVISKKKIKKTKKNSQETTENILKNVNSSFLSKRSTIKKLSLKEKIEFQLSKASKIPIKEISIFTEKFYLLKKANFNNIHALSTIIESTENMALREILADVLAGIEGGESMYSTLEYYSNVFPYIYLNIIKVGELSGTLTRSLEQALVYLEESQKLSKRVKSIIIPNAVQFGAIFLMLIFGTLFALPAIQKVYASVGSTASLPPLSLWFSNTLNVVLKYWYVPTSIVFIAAGTIIWYINTPKGRFKFHYFKYTMPIFGKLIYSLDFTNLMKAVYLNIQNGMRIQEALEVSKNVVRNFVMISIIETANNNILLGKSWIEPFEQANLSSSMVTEMLNIGMKTDLSEMLEKLLEYMEMDINQTLEKIIKALPQIVYSIVGIVLIFFVLVVLVPVMEAYMGDFMWSAGGF